MRSFKISQLRPSKIKVIFFKIANNNVQSSHPNSFALCKLGFIPIRLVTLIFISFLFTIYFQRSCDIIDWRWADQDWSTPLKIDTLFFVSSQRNISQCNSESNFSKVSFCQNGQRGWIEVFIGINRSSPEFPVKNSLYGPDRLTKICN